MEMAAITKAESDSMIVGMGCQLSARKVASLKANISPYKTEEHLIFSTLPCRDITKMISANHTCTSFLCDMNPRYVTVDLNFLWLRSSPDTHSIMSIMSWNNTGSRCHKLLVSLNSKDALLAFMPVLTGSIIVP